MNDDTQINHIPARDIPLPSSVSDEARAMLARGPAGVMPPWPPLSDTAGWLAVVKAMNEGAEAILASILDAGSSAPDATVDTMVGDVPVYVARPDDVSGDDLRVVLHLHGGAWVQGGGALCRAGAAPRAAVYGATTWSVDYRMPPEHPFPAAHDDAIAVYRALLKDRSPDRIVIGGDSAGANIAAGLVLRIRDEGLPLPAGLVLDTPATDLTAGSDSLFTNLGVDTVLVGDFEPTMAIYAGSAERTHPYISPIFADFTQGFPPTILLTGTRDRLLSDTVRLHRVLLSARIPVELHVFEAQGHGGFLGSAPEDQDRSAEIRRFVDECVSRSD